MAVSAAPLVVVGVLALLARQRGASASGPAAKPQSDDRYCDDLDGIWHEPVGKNLPITIAGYEKSYNVIDGLLAQGPTTKDAAVLTALDALTHDCPWGSVELYSPRMRDVKMAVEVTHDNVVADRGGS
jgi:hypothetical protein